MAPRVVTKIKRVPYEATLFEDKNRFYGTVTLEGKILKKLEPLFDQDEAEVELGVLLDAAWREKSGSKDKLVRRI